MAFGSSDNLQEVEKAEKAAVNLLLAVAKKKKRVADVRVWLEKKYPELCRKKTTTKVW